MSGPGGRLPRPPATVVVCTRERPQLLAACVESIGEDLSLADELIVVESGGADASEALHRLPPTVEWRHVRSSDRRKTSKINAVVAGGTHEALLLTDDDCRVAHGWVDAMTRALTSSPEVGLTFGPVQGLTSAPGHRPPTLPPGPAPVEHWNFAHGASMAVRREALFDAGGFDERFGPGASIRGGEEADLLLRLTTLGWRCTIADAPIVTHADWRDDRADRRNLLVYERSSGAWLGAALRRDPVRNAELALLRLRYQAHLWTDHGTRGWGFGPRTSGAFVAGLARGMMLSPRRWLP